MGSGTLREAHSRLAPLMAKMSSQLSAVTSGVPWWNNGKGKTPTKYDLRKCGIQFAPLLPTDSKEESGWDCVCIITSNRLMIAVDALFVLPLFPGISLEALVIEHQTEFLFWQILNVWHHHGSPRAGDICNRCSQYAPEEDSCSKTLMMVSWTLKSSTICRL